MPSLTNIISPPASPLLSLIGFSKKPSSSTTTINNSNHQPTNNNTPTNNTNNNNNNTNNTTSSCAKLAPNLELSDIADHDGFVSISPTSVESIPSSSDSPSSVLSSNSSLIGSGWLSSGGSNLMTPLTSWFQLSNITTPLTDNIKNVSDNIKTSTSNIRTFVTSTLKGALSLTSSSGSMKGKEGLGDFVFVEHDDTITQKPTTQESLIQISLNLYNLTEYSSTLSPLFYNDELLPIDEYKQFLIDYSEKINTFLLKYFKMEPNIGINSKNLLELYDLCSLITKDQQSKYSQNIEKCIQKLIFEIIAVDGTFNVHYEKDTKLYKKLKLFQNVLEPKHISLPNDFYKNEEAAWNECIHLLRKLNQYKTPYGKIYIVEKVFKRVSEICTQVDRAFSSDHLLSCLIYLVLKACPHNLNSDMWFLVTFCLDGIYRNEGSELDFLLTTMYCALEFWENVPAFDQTEQSDEKIFKSFIVDEQEKTKFRKAFKLARRKTQTLEKIIIENFTSKN